jgi:hypothetical protein
MPVVESTTGSRAIKPALFWGGSGDDDMLTYDDVPALDDDYDDDASSDDYYCAEKESAHSEPPPRGKQGVVPGSRKEPAWKQDIDLPDSSAQTTSTMPKKKKKKKKAAPDTPAAAATIISWASEYAALVDAALEGDSGSVRRMNWAIADAALAAGADPDDAALEASTNYESTHSLAPS